jgi:hypothetical protein
MQNLCARHWVLASALIAGTGLRAADIRLDDLSKLEFENTRAEITKYHGKPGLKMVEEKPGPGGTATLKGLVFRDGEIDLEVSGAPSKTADPAARGFIGIVFRIQPDGSHAESFYLRPTNGRADDQLQRNHSVQYVSPPDWTWQRLRKETPGVYESYADMQAGEWTRMRIVVHGKEAQLYVGGAAQPCLIVKDLKLGESTGGVALWIGPDTEGYFRNVRVTPSGP